MNVAVKLVPGLDTLRVRIICGRPKMVFEAKVTRDLKALMRQVMSVCLAKGSLLTAGLAWACGEARSGMILITDAALSDDPDAEAPDPYRRATAGSLAGAGRGLPGRV